MGLCDERVGICGTDGDTSQAFESAGLSVVSRVCHNSRSNSHPRTPD
jgi:hypothetical protein